MAGPGVAAESVRPPLRPPPTTLTLSGSGSQALLKHGHYTAEAIARRRAIAPAAFRTRPFALEQKATGGRHSKRAESLSTQVIEYPVTICNVHGLHFFELPQQTAGICGVVPVPLKFGYNFPLARKVLLAFGDMVLGLG